MQTLSNPSALRTVTQLFPVFMGLRLLPFGLWFAIAPLGVVGPMTEWNQAVPVAVAVVATWAIHVWYASHYGRVEPRKLRFGRNWALLLAVVVGYTALALTPRTLDIRPVVLLVVLVVFATAIAIMLPRALTRGYGAIAAFLVLAAAGAVILLVLTRGDAGISSLGVSLSLITGVLLILAGAIEHWLLLRALGRSMDA